MKIKPRYPEAAAPKTGKNRSEIESALVEGFFRADRGCVEKIIVKLYRTVFLNCLKITRGAYDAEKLAQDTFVTALRARKKYDSKDEFIEWLLKISADLCIGHLKSEEEKRRPQANSKFFDSGGGVMTKQDIEEAQSRLKIDFKTAEIAFATALEIVPADCRMAFICVHVLFLSYAEASDLLATPIETVKSRVNRAKYFLAKVLEKE